MLRPTRILSFTSFGLALAVFYLGCGPNSDGSKLRELERLEAGLPVFPSMAERSASKTSKGTIAVISKLYSSDAPYDDIKKFYVTELGQRRWEYIGERLVKDWGRDLGGYVLTFRSGEYRLSISYSGKNADYGWDYAVEIVWGS